MKKSFFILQFFLIYFLLIDISFADLQKNIINKLTATQTLTFDFKQRISDKEEVGKCFIEYPLLMKCIYNNQKQKTVISNGIKVAVIKKKYKKIYSYPIKTTPLFFILQKEKIIDLIRKTEPKEINSELVGFRFIYNKKNKIDIFFDKESLEFKGWETKDAYSNNVSFIISNLQINNQFANDFFKVPEEKDL